MKYGGLTFCLLFLLLAGCQGLSGPGQDSQTFQPPAGQTKGVETTGGGDQPLSSDPLILTPSASSLAIAKFAPQGYVPEEGSVGNLIEILSGAKVTLEWETKGANEVELLKNNEVIASNLPTVGTYDVVADIDANYTLHVHGTKTSETSTFSLATTDAICLLQKDCYSNAGKEKGLHSVMQNTHAFRKPDGTDCLLVPDSGNNRVVLYCGDEISQNKPGLVLGQVDFYSTIPNRGGTPHLGTVKGPFGAWSDGKRVIVADTGNSRLLIWNQFPTINGQFADLVLGQINEQMNLAAQGIGPTQSSLRFPSAVWVDPETQKIIVADTNHSRVVIWNNWPDEDGEKFDVVIGQADFTSAAPNRGGKGTANTLNWPRGVSTFEGKLIVSDSENNRVLIYNQIPTKNDASADVVIGQPNFSSINQNQGSVYVSNFFYDKVEKGPTAFSFFWPSAAYIERRDKQDVRLWVSDGMNERVLRFSKVPDKTSEVASCDVKDVDGNFVCPEADRVLGMADVKQRWSDLFAPGTIEILNDKLLGRAAASPPLGCRMFVTSRVARIMEFDICTISGNNPSAIGLIGQPNFQTWGRNHVKPSEQISNGAWGIAADSKNLWVGDLEDHRVIGFSGVPTFSGAKAIALMGQKDFSGDLKGGGLETVTKDSLSAPNNIFVDPYRLFVPDTGNRRLLIFKRNDKGLPVGDPLVLGQSDLNSALPLPDTNPSCGRFMPNSVTTDSQRVFVTDLTQHRILVFEPFPEKPETEAKFVLGQTDCNGKKPNQDLSAPSASSLYYPRSVFSDGKHLVIADSWNHRVLYYENLPTDFNAPATFVIGQANFKSRKADSPSPKSLIYPFAAIIHRGLIFVSDYGNHRVLVFKKPTENYPEAIHDQETKRYFVFGQKGPTEAFANSGGSLNAEGLHNPMGIWVQDKFLIISDFGNQRIVIRNIEGLLNKFADPLPTP